MASNTTERDANNMDVQVISLQRREDSCSWEDYEYLAKPRFGDQYNTGESMVIEWYGRKVVEGQTLAFWFDLRTQAQNNFQVSIIQNGTIDGAAAAGNRTGFLNLNFPYKGIEVRDECNRAGMRYNWTIPANLYSLEGASSPFDFRMRAAVNYNFDWGNFGTYSTANTTYTSQGGIIINNSVSKPADGTGAGISVGPGNSTDTESIGLTAQSSNATKIGVGVGSALAASLLLIWLFFFCRRRRHGKSRVDNPMVQQVSKPRVEDKESYMPKSSLNNGERHVPEAGLDERDISNQKFRTQDLSELMKPTLMAQRGVDGSCPGAGHVQDKESLKVPLYSRPGGH